MLILPKVYIRQLCMKDTATFRKQTRHWSLTRTIRRRYDATRPEQDLTRLFQDMFHTKLGHWDAGSGTLNKRYVSS